MVFLVIDVVSDHLLIKTNGGNKVPPSPKRAWWEFLGLLFDPRGALAFHNLNGIGNTVLWWDIHVEMDVVISNVPSMNTKTFPLCNGLEYSLELCFDVSICHHFASVLRDPNQMVLTIVCAVTELV